jgi:hypothetical protein
VNALAREQADHRRLEQDFLDWRIEQARKQGTIRPRRKDTPPEGGRRWSWDQLTGKADPPPPLASSRPRQARQVKSVVLPMPMDGWTIR